MNITNTTPNAAGAMQPADTLSEMGVRLTITPTDSGKCPPFCDGKHIHGDEHRCTFSRGGRSLRFSFWNSLNDARTGTPADLQSVVNCVAMDGNCPQTFEDFCAEYGYDEDSRKAERTFRTCADFARRINAFFTAEELEKLAELDR
jgi:hypothetical protein